MEEQIKGAFDFNSIGEMVETYIEEHQEEINQMILKSITDRLDI